MLFCVQMYRNGHFNTKLKILKVLGHGNEDLSRGKVKIIIESVGLVDFREECAGPDRCQKGTRKRRLAAR